MFKFIRNNRKIRTKNLYCAELVKNDETYLQHKTLIKAIPFNPRKYTLVRKKEYGYKDNKYKDIFTKSSYYLFGDFHTQDQSIVINNLVPVCTNKKYIKYKDADKIFEDLNTHVKTKKLGN